MQKQLRKNEQLINRYELYKHTVQNIQDKHERRKKNLPSASFLSSTPSFCNSSSLSQDAIVEESQDHKMRQIEPDKKASCLQQMKQLRSERTPSYAARTRTLIQIGGLFDKAGLLSEFDLKVGDDLQRDVHTFDSAATLLGALLDLKKQLQENPDDSVQYLWRLKGKKALRK